MAGRGRSLSFLNPQDLVPADSVVTQEHRGFRYARARNNGAKLARAPLLAFINDDCLPNPEFLENYRNAFARGPYLRGEIIFVASWDALEQVTDRHLPSQGIWGSNFSIARDLFCDSGGLDEDFVDQTGEDTDLERRLSLLGVVGVEVEGAHVYHLGGSHSGGQPNTLYCEVKVNDPTIRRNVGRWD